MRQWIRPTMIGLAVLLACGEPQPPTCSAIEDQSIHTGEEVTVTPDCLDPEDGQLSYTAESVDEDVATVECANCVTDPEPPRPEFTITAISPGETVVTITAANLTTSLSDMSDVKVIVPNRPPVQTKAIVLPELRLNEPPIRYDLNDHFEDPDGFDLTFSAESSDPSVVSATVSASRLELKAHGIGQSTLTVTATDQSDEFVSYTTDLEVVNDPPTIIKALDLPQFVRNESISIDLNDHFADPEMGVLTYTASQRDSIALITLSGSIMEMIGEKIGTSFLTVIATDNADASVELVEPFHVVNQPPEVVKPLGFTLMELDESLTIDLNDHFTDPDGDALTYTAISSSPSVISASMLDASRVMLTAQTGGNTTITATAADPSNASVELATVIWVDNSPPRVVKPIDVPTLGVDENHTIDLSEHFEDPDEEALTYTAGSSNPAIVSVTVSASSMSLTGHAEGSITLTATATDESGASVETSTQVTVMKGNEPPRVVKPLDIPLLVVGDVWTVSLAEHFTDPDDLVLTYAATSSNPSVIVVTVTSASLMTITVQDTGSTVITATATDAAGAMAETSATVTIMDDPDGDDLTLHGRRSRSPVPDGFVPSVRVDCRSSRKNDYGK